MISENQQNLYNLCEKDLFCTELQNLLVTDLKATSLKL